MVQTGCRDYGTFEKSVYSIILPTQSRLYLTLLSNAHSVCLNLHLLLALNIAWNVCAAWQRESLCKGKRRMKFVLLNTHSPWCGSSEGCWGKEAWNCFLQPSLGRGARAERRFLWIALWQYLLKALVCFRAIVWLCLFSKLFAYPTVFLAVECVLHCWVPAWSEPVFSDNSILTQVSKLQRFGSLISH